MLSICIEQVLMINVYCDCRIVLNRYSWSMYTATVGLCICKSNFFFFRDDCIIHRYWCHSGNETEQSNVGISTL